MERVYPDTNVLYPISIADLTLRLADVQVHEVIWSADLLAEVERVLVGDKGLTPDQAAYFCECIRTAFPEGEIAKGDYVELVESRTGPDPDDHVHSAAALAGGATVLLTSDNRGFPKRDLGAVRRVGPDAYFLEQLEAFPEEVIGVLGEMGASRREPKSIHETLSALAAAGVPRFVAEVRRVLGYS